MIVVHKLLHELREELALSSAATHWHGGPDPCPKCGGIGPSIKGPGRRQVIVDQRPGGPTLA